MKKCFTRAQAREAVHKKTKPYCESDLIRATSAQAHFKRTQLSREGAQPCYPVTTVISAFRSMA